MDLNSNNKVSKEEFILPVQNRFSALDKNSDEVLDRRELNNLKKDKKKARKNNRDNMWKGRVPNMHKKRINN